MGDIKLFRTLGVAVDELGPSTIALEKSLQTLFEANLEALLGVRFLATEYSTGAKHGGRIDSLGIDENSAPVIIEYKRASNENVINQGLFYLDWLVDHRAEFTMLCMKQLGIDEETIDWSSPRLICVAGGYSKYDEHAVAQINRSIDLVRYSRYGDEFLLLELVNSVTGSAASPPGPGGGKGPTGKTQYKTVTEYLAQAPFDLQDLFGALEAHLTALGDDVVKKTTRLYFAFRRIKNFACVEVHPQTKQLLVYVKVDPDEVTLVEGFTRDVRSIGHFGTGDLEIRIGSLDDLEAAKPLLARSYDAS